MGKQSEVVVETETVAATAEASYWTVTASSAPRSQSVVGQDTLVSAEEGKDTDLEDQCLRGKPAAAVEVEVEVEVAIAQWTAVLAGRPHSSVNASSALMSQSEAPEVGATACREQGGR
jgi:hypothetical protein